VMDESQVLKESTKEAQQDNLLEALVHHKKWMYLACYFGDHGKGAGLVISHGEEIIQAVPASSREPIQWQPLSVPSRALQSPENQKMLHKRSRYIQTPFRSSVSPPRLCHNPAPVLQPIKNDI
jgi:hypothetical protein